MEAYLCGRGSLFRSILGHISHSNKPPLPDAQVGEGNGKEQIGPTPRGHSGEQALSNASLQAAQAYVTLTGSVTLATYPHVVPSTGDHTARAREDVLS
jgi:hypothetical protein